MFAQKTLYHLMNDRLMPELPCFEEDRLFRGCWGFLHRALTVEAPGYLDPSEAFDAAGFPVDDPIRAEWKGDTLNAQELQNPPPYHKILTFYPQAHKVGFFVFLAWQSMHLFYHSTEKEIQKERKTFQKKYLLMQFFAHLEQYITDNAQRESARTIRDEFHGLMAFYWIKAYRYFHALLDPRSLNYFEEELINGLKIGCSSSPFLTMLVEAHDLEKKIVLPAPSDDPDDLSRLIYGVQTDMNILKKQLNQVRLGDSIASDDRYVTPKKAYELLRIPPQTLSNWRLKGKLHHYRQVGNRYEYSLRELKTYLETPQKRPSK